MLAVQETIRVKTTDFQDNASSMVPSQLGMNHRGLL